MSFSLGPAALDKKVLVGFVLVSIFCIRDFDFYIKNDKQSIHNY